MQHLTRSLNRAAPSGCLASRCQEVPYFWSKSAGFFLKSAVLLVTHTIEILISIVCIPRNVNFLQFLVGLF